MTHMKDLSGKWRTDGGKEFYGMLTGTPTISSEQRRRETPLEATGGTARNVQKQTQPNSSTDIGSLNADYGR